jgi:hypothetical protein
MTSLMGLHRKADLTLEYLGEEDDEEEEEA